MTEIKAHLGLPALSGSRTRTGPAPRRPAPVSGLKWRRQYQWRLRLCDAAAIICSIFGTGAILVPGTGGAAAPNLVFSAVLALFWIATMYLFRTRDPRLIGFGAGEYKRVLSASFATFGSLAVVLVALDLDGYSRLMAATLPLGLLGLLLGRWLWRHWLERKSAAGHYLSRVVVVGQFDDIRYVIGQVVKTKSAAYEVVGAVLEGRSKIGWLNAGPRQIPLVAGLDNVEATVASTGADAVIIAGSLHRGGGFVRELGWALEKSETELVVASALTNVAGPRILMRPVEGLPLMHVERPQFTGGRHLVKRGMDIVLSAAGILALSPLLLAIAVLIRLDSEGGIIFRQDRVGRQNTVFKMLKFRSMVVTAEAELARLKDLDEGNGMLFKMRDDPRVTRVGKWIRKHSLDELPQLFNVLKGDMSLVGPRPPLSSEVEKYEGHANRRLFIKPGCTGLWQINGRSDLDWEESIRLDLYYVENWSVAGDLIIMWRTFKVMLKPVGAY